MANKKETVLAALVDYLKVNGFPDSKTDAQAPDAAIVLLTIQDARIIVRLGENEKYRVALYVYESKQSGKKSWDKFKDKILWMPTGSVAGKFGKQIEKNTLDEADAVLVKYDLNADWRKSDFAVAGMLKICEAAKELVCRIV